MINREIAPTLHAIDEITLQKPEELVFANGLKVFVFPAAEQELIKAEFVFRNVFEGNENPVANVALGNLLKEGTSNLSSARIAEEIDYYGAYLVPEYSFDHNALTLYTLRKHVDSVLPIVHDVLTDAIFPEKELNTYVRNNQQNLQISMEKSDFLARRRFYHELFSDTRYGISLTKESLGSLTREQVLNLYKKQIQPSNATLFLSGNITNEVIAKFKEYFELQWTNQALLDTTAFPALEPLLPSYSKIDKPAALQSAIRLGKRSIQRSHVDYPALQFTNTLFGGYFGSRLMSNIREEKGYTYSIGSAVANLNHAGFLTIATEVGVEYTNDTLVEIQKEMNRLQDELVSDQEMELVRNYMLGSMLGSLESVFSHVDKFKSVYFSGLTLDYYDYYTKIIQQMSPLDVQQIAGQYLRFDDMIKIVVGGEVE
ncbi:insulinase family protein [Sphingobacterium sp. DK4209]|uniref:Insulinase family protein n=1 Tax=Sphingobacterium zhuxiongii TaxID=2662364 RepID=A0A5Q0Q9Z5_9SPHI|nr:MULTISPECIES: pitrilysin family protein [unclassified Sphingobacterium]MVZ66581.1 insulinase family protein [Sphingobacterium sp. DK4209]QGA26765.1 insulinase family protein [Sphingobacterium sp. dk4302]